MSQSKRYKKALRAAKSVVRGTRKHATTAATGITLLTMPACLDPVPASLDTSSQADTKPGDIISDLQDLVFDTLAPDVLADVQAMDAAVKDEVVEPTDAPATPSDAAMQDAAVRIRPPRTYQRRPMCWHASIRATSRRIHRARPTPIAKCQRTFPEHAARPKWTALPQPLAPRASNAMALSRRFSLK